MSQFMLKCVGTPTNRSSRPHSAGGVYNVAGITQVYGSCSQFDLSGKYNGNQCTSMSAAAGVLWLLKASNTLVEVTNEMVNDIVLNGHTLHTRLRDEFKVTSVNDLRVGIEDLYRSDSLVIDRFFNRTLSLNLTHLPEYVLTKSNDRAGDIPGLENFLLRQPTQKHQAFVITVSDYSFCILKTVSEEYLLFDSHGYPYVYKGRSMVEKASIFKLGPVQRLAKFLVALYGKTLCEIAELQTKEIIQVAPAEQTADDADQDKKTEAIAEEIRDQTREVRTKSRQNIDNRPASYIHTDPVKPTVIDVKPKPVTETLTEAEQDDFSGFVFFMGRRD